MPGSWKFLTQFSRAFSAAQLICLPYCPGNGKPLGKMVRWKTAAAQLMQRIRHTIAMLHMEKTNQTAEEGYWKFPHWKILTNLYR